jgi:hypothetical protein
LKQAKSVAASISFQAQSQATDTQRLAAATAAAEAALADPAATREEAIAQTLVAMRPELPAEELWRALRVRASGAPSAYALSDWAAGTRDQLLRQEQAEAKRKAARSRAGEAGTEEAANGKTAAKGGASESAERQVSKSAGWISRAARLEALSLDASAEPGERLALAQELAEWQRAEGSAFAPSAAEGAWQAAQWLEVWHNKDRAIVFAAKRMEMFARLWRTFAGGCLRHAQEFAARSPASPDAQQAAEILALAAAVALRVASLPRAEADWSPADVDGPGRPTSFGRQERASAAQLREAFAKAWAAGQAEQAIVAGKLGSQVLGLPAATAEAFATASGRGSAAELAQAGDAARLALATAAVDAAMAARAAESDKAQTPAAPGQSQAQDAAESQSFGAKSEAKAKPDRARR